MMPKKGRTLVKVSVSARLSQNGKPPSGNAVEASINQCVADAVEGSFDEYPRHLKKLARLRATRLSDHVEEGEVDSEVVFSFGLPAELFPVDKGGLQLLVSFLAGDIFPSEVQGCKWSGIPATA